jgi:hypothetical protein
MKQFVVREYDEFPIKKDNDKLIKECDDLETAKFERQWYSSRAKMGERYYIADMEQPWKEATQEVEKAWRQALNSCGLYPTK